MAKKLSQSEIEADAIKLVTEERTKWEDALVQITPEVAMTMRSAIKMFRKNYVGKFDDPNMDKNGVWIPITEQGVEDKLTDTDLDQKDLHFRATNKESRKTTSTVRAIVKTRLDQKFFGQDLDNAERSKTIDGTVVWKIWKGKDEFGKLNLMYKQLDLLNCYIDPHADNIQKAHSFIERLLLPVDEVKAMEGFVNTDDLKGATNLAKEESSGGQTQSNTKEVELFERWGLMPKYFITAKRNDTQLIQGRIVISGRGDSAKAHFIGKNTSAYKPYEENWFIKTPGSWYGRGIPQKLIGLQVYANMTKNIHIIRQKVSQLGLFKVKKGRSITPAMLKGLSVNGVIEVTDMDDIQQMVVQEASASHYRDMEEIKAMAQAVTSTVGTISPENLPASAPATTSVINDRNNKSSSTKIRETTGFWLMRMVDRHFLPIIMATTSLGEIISIVGDDSGAKDLLERAVAKEAMKELKQNYEKYGTVPTEQEFNFAFNKATAELKKGDILLSLKESFDPKNYKMRPVKAFVTNEELDAAVQIQDFLSLAGLVPEARMEIMRDVYDLLGKEAPTIDPPQPEQQQPQQGKLPKDIKGGGSLQEETTKALTNIGGVV